ncbi:uncharacterized protein LOC105281176 isoform X2 [Ooceraea biroi]|uniref:uncharacterized protein LOC105281176 isoform X2 n=1 Tax=Ooceraea biroi TaxID=2015173 RepID=UPI0005BD7BC7|nr:uncharacterized protein LOC105281176 isoform X2 [Ooceraea biroi]
MDNKIHNSRVMSVPPDPHARKPIRLEDCDKSYASDDFHKLHRKSERSPDWLERNTFEDEELSVNGDDIDYDGQMTRSPRKARNEEIQSSRAQSHSRTASPQRRKTPSKRESRYRGSSGNEPDVYSLSWLFTSFINIVWHHPFISIAILLLFMCMLRPSMSEKHVQHMDNPNLLLCKSIEEVRAKFHNQESDIWNDISSAINEIISRTPKVPSIILLYANETSTMNCLATEIARVSSTLLHTDGPMHLDPKDFGDDAGVIINELNERLPSKKVVIIRDILNINAKAIRALHNLCDRINPLVGEAIYILTMQTNGYESTEKRLALVEKQIYRKLSESIDRDILSALVTRITDGAIVSVQPEPHLRYCT